MPHAVLSSHIVSGLLAIASGYVALFALKGSQIHRGAGRVFAVSMTMTGISAAYLGFVTKDMSDVVGGTMTLYLVATAWLAASRSSGKAGPFEKACCVFAVLGAIASFIVALETQRSGASEVGSGPAFIFAGFVSYAAILDLRVMLRGLSERQRVARHLWRMCLALFVASGSFFLGQMDVFPAPLRRIEVLAIPVLAVIALMIMWLVRVLLTSWWKGESRQKDSSRARHPVETDR